MCHTNGQGLQGGLLHNKRTPSQRRRDLVAYFVLTFAFSWAIEIPLALSAQGLTSVRVPFGLHYLASFGPFFAAVVLTVATEGFPGLGRLFGGLTKWRAQRVYILFALVAPLVVFGGIVLVSRALQGSWPDLGLLGQVDYLGHLGIVPALLLWLLTFGLGEETGWRGFALPRLQAGRSAFSASMLLGVFWALWHLPALFYRDTYIQMGWLVLPMLITVAAVGSVVYTWLFNGTGGSLLWLVLFHGLFDFLSVWPAGAIGPGPVLTTLMVFWAVRVYKVYGPANLAPREKVTI
jgi:membrane protease YdiL (CAAX protease family)